MGASNYYSEPHPSQYDDEYRRKGRPCYSWYMPTEKYYLVLRVFKALFVYSNEFSQYTSKKLAAMFTDIVGFYVSNGVIREVLWLFACEPDDRRKTYPRYKIKLKTI